MQLFHFWTALLDYMQNLYLSHFSVPIHVSSVIPAGALVMSKKSPNNKEHISKEQQSVL